MLRVGVDAGGTFTDLVAFAEDGSRAQAKVPSVPSDPVQAVVAAVDAAAFDAADIGLLVVGTTIGTNALVERRGARVAYLGTEGFEDVPFIQRGNRPRHYDLHWRKPLPFLERERCLGVPERVDYAGREVVAVDVDRLEEVLREVERLDVDSVAVNFLFSYRAPEHELQVGARVRERLPAVAVSLSHEIAPVWREYERGVTTIADAYLKPLLGRFVGSLREELSARGFRGRISLLKSNGGVQIDTEAAKRPVQLSLSGVAGGVIGGISFAPERSDLVTLDMGGTSCDIAIVAGGAPRLTSRYEPEFGLPLLFPSIEAGTIGAGGGSIAWIDDGGFLRVGPQSASAEPGPASYGKGGVEPTLTDANLVLGRLDADYFLGGGFPLDARAARASFGSHARRLGVSLEQAALAVVRIADDNMAAAIYERSLDVGIDLRGFALVAFGGAGPLHACAVARALDITRVLVPPHPGLCSAFGAATAELRSDRIATAYFRSDTARVAEINAIIARLGAEACAELQLEGFEGEPVITTRLGLRYAGQNFEHTIDLPGAKIDDEILALAFAEFEGLHNRFYGYDLGGHVIELIELGVTARAPSRRLTFAAEPVNAAPRRRRLVILADGVVDAVVVRRSSLSPGDTLVGPAIVEEPDSTVLLEHGDALLVLPDRTIAIDVARRER